VKIALMGSVSSTWHTLDALIKGGVEIAGVLGVDESQAEKISDYRPLRELAEPAGVPFHPFIKVSEPGVEQFLRAHKPDMLWVIGLSQLVPDRLIEIAPAGGVGFHPTMLPEGRGRAPVAWTILKAARAAANLFFLTDEADAGDIIIQREVPVLPDDYSEDLIERTNQVLHAAVLELAPRIKTGDIPRTPQDHTKASYYPKRTPADGVIDWTATTDAIYRLIRAAGRPYPGAFTHHGQQKLTIWRGKPADTRSGEADAPPGRILQRDPDQGVLVKTSDGTLWMTEIELDGVPADHNALEVGDQLA